MVYCFSEPDMVHVVLEKAAAFLIAYIQAYRDAGANGVVIAGALGRPAVPGAGAGIFRGLLQQIVDAVQREDFVVIYHNCGNTTIQTLDSIFVLRRQSLPFRQRDLYGRNAGEIPFGYPGNGKYRPRRRLPQRNSGAHPAGGFRSDGFLRPIS